MAGLLGPAGGSAADDLSLYRVTDPNASFFAIGERPGAVPAGHTAASCPEESLAAPIDHFVTIPAFYRDPEGWRRASQPFFAFEAQAAGFAEAYVRSGAPDHARCLVALLTAWAERRALMDYDHQGNHGQAWYAIQWSTAAAGLAYSVVRAEPALSERRKQAVEDWLVAVASKQIGFPGNPIACCNNHRAWRGLQAAIVGVVAGDDRLFRYGVGAYRAALASMNPDGSLPHEMERGKRALHYQNFAVLPLVFIAEIAARQGYDLYGLEIGGRNLHVAVDFLLRALDDPEALRPYSREAQDLSFVERRAELAWLEPYHRRFPGSQTAHWLARLRPLAHNWIGGPATLYFSEPATVSTALAVQTASD